MLRFLIGKAGTGKTSAIYRELRDAVERREKGIILLVPEQYSHEAERELCRICGDGLSLTAEVLSFTGLARRTAQERGGLGAPLLDKGGRLLCMALALDAVGQRLQVYGAARQRSELQSMLLQAVDELKGACVNPEQLLQAAEVCHSGLSKKLQDLALVLSAYDAVVSNGHADPSDRLNLLARQIEEGAMGAADRVYVDGFLDFTVQEHRVLTAMLARGVDLTVCLTMDGPRGADEIFAPSRAAFRKLAEAAAELGVTPEIGGQELRLDTRKAPELRVFGEELFRFSETKYETGRDLGDGAGENGASSGNGAGEKRTAAGDGAGEKRANSGDGAGEKRAAAGDGAGEKRADSGDGMSENGASSGDGAGGRPRELGDGAADGGDRGGESGRAGADPGAEAGRERACCIRLGYAENMSTECEAAAAYVLSLVREKGCRWRDIAVAVRGFGDYQSTLESVFRQYGIPLFVTKRSDLMQKPLPAFISLAYELQDSGWEVDDMLSFLGTGLSGLEEDACDLLADYVYKWQLRKGAWEREADWRQHPDGYGAEYTPETEERLGRINALRRQLARPLLRFSRRSEEAHTAREQAEALAALMEEMGLPDQLQRRAALQEQDGREELAAQTRQLWDLTVSALEQTVALLGELEMDAQTFGRLFTHMLSQYDIGLIPVSLDRVSAGDFDRMRRRSLRYLLVLGCCDGRLPATRESAGVFSDEEREELLALEIDLGAGERELWREFALIYSCFTLPSEGLWMSYPLRDHEGERLRPAYVYERAERLFGIKPVRLSLDAARLSAPRPALSLAAHALQNPRPVSAAAAEYFRQTEPERFRMLERAARSTRGRLSPRAVEAIYGSRLYLSASKIDRFASCRFAYFCEYGLKAKRYEPLGFQPPEIGTFIHAVLEQVARQVKELGGYRSVSDEQIRGLTHSCVEEYIRAELNDFQEKSARFEHLFRRLCGDAERIVLEMAKELRRSDFEPIDFELNFSKARDILPLELGEDETAMTMTGIADRVDGWVHEGKLYLRVVDYKTGKKTFSLSDVWQGMGLQMLLYLFTLQHGGEGRYGMPIVPAGVMYVPARSELTAIDPGEDPEKERAKAIRRSGLVLNAPEVLEAWEHGEDKRYIPVKLSGRGKEDKLADLERMGSLARHIGRTLKEMAAQLHRGNITADPYYRGQQASACEHCDYVEACFFRDGENGESCRYLPKLDDQRVWELLKEEDEDDA